MCTNSHKVWISASSASFLHLPVLQILTLFHRHPVRSSSKEQLHGNILQEWNSVFHLSWQKHFPEALSCLVLQGPFAFTRGSVAPSFGGHPWPVYGQNVTRLWPRSKPGCYYGPDMGLAKGAVCFHSVSGRHEMTWGRFPICSVPTTWERKQMLWCHVVCLISIKCLISALTQRRPCSHRQCLGNPSPTFFAFMRTYFLSMWILLEIIGRSICWMQHRRFDVLFYCHCFLQV